MRKVGQFVDRRVTRLQQDGLAHKPEAIATLARLRRGVGKEPGELPDLLQVTLIPDTNSEGGPSINERAAYVAITLYALHQQSKSDSMHRPGHGLGAAVRRLATGGNENAVRRRFEALGTSLDFSEFVYHARGLITQLRSDGIPLDYGLLADQLVSLQYPSAANSVRLDWGRGFYRASNDATSEKEEES